LLRTRGGRRGRNHSTRTAAICDCRGGPTGIEIATEIQDLIHEVLLKRYPEIHQEHPEVSVIQSGPQILPGLAGQSRSEHHETAETPPD